MGHVIEESKSNRASCRTCRKKIDKGILRFGEEVPNAFDPDGGKSYAWHHLECAATKVPHKLKEAMAAYAGEIPNRAELEAAIANAKPARGGPKAAFPYAERAATGRSKCMQCDEAIEKGALRIAVEREVDTGAFTTSGPGYLHVGCAVEYTSDQALFEKVKTNSPGLQPADLEELK